MTGQQKWVIPIRTTAIEVYWKPGTSVQNTRQWTVTKAPYHQSTTLDLPTETSCSLITLLLHHASNILYVHMFWHYIIIAILVSLLSLLLSFLSSPHLLSLIPAIHVYKTPAGFVTLSILTDQDPGLSRNIWIKWLWHRPVIFWLVEFPIILIPVHVWWISRAINILHNMKSGGTHAILLIGNTAHSACMQRLIKCISNL